jgi:hypothetical protein
LWIDVGWGEHPYHPAADGELAGLRPPDKCNDPGGGERDAGEREPDGESEVGGERPQVVEQAGGLGTGVG